MNMMPNDTDAKSGGAAAAKSAVRRHGGMPVDEALKILQVEKKDLVDPARILAVSRIVAMLWAAEDCPI